MGALEGGPEITKVVTVVGAVKATASRRSILVPPEFMAQEAMRANLPRRCPACKNSKSVSSK
jgi:hypothetical protein